jgi:hypothetical protein
LGEAEADAEGDHHAHDGSGAHIAGCEGDGRECGEEQYKGVEACTHEQSEESVLFVRGHGVGPVLVESRRGLLVREAFEGASEPLQSDCGLTVGKFNKKWRDLNRVCGTPGRGRKLPG